MGKLSSAFDKAGVAPLDDESMEPSGPESVEGPSTSREEVSAFKAFKNAKSPEEGASALKDFIKLCSGGY